MPVSGQDQVDPSQASTNRVQPGFRYRVIAKRLLQWDDADYQDHLAMEKHDAIWRAIQEDPYTNDTLPAIASRGAASGPEQIPNFGKSPYLSKLFDLELDARPARDKLLHAFGVAGKARWVPIPGHPYTGFFATESEVIVRMSVGGDTNDFIAGLGVKMFRDGKPSVNVLVSSSFEKYQKGDPRGDFFIYPLTSIIAKPQTAVNSILTFMFSFTSNPFVNPVDHIAKTDPTGAHVPNPRWPEMLSAISDVNVGELGNGDFRIALMEKVKSGTHVYTIYAHDKKEDPKVPIAKIIMESDLMANWFGDRHLVFQHRRGKPSRFTRFAQWVARTLELEDATEPETTGVAEADYEFALEAMRDAPRQMDDAAQVIFDEIKNRLETGWLDWAVTDADTRVIIELLSSLDPARWLAVIEKLGSTAEDGSPLEDGPAKGSLLEKLVKRGLNDDESLRTRFDHLAQDMMNTSPNQTAAILTFLGVGEGMEIGRDTADDERSQLYAGEILSRTHQEPNSRVGVRVRGLVKAPPERVWPLVDNIEGYPQVFSEINEAELLSRNGDNVHVKLMLNFPAPIPDFSEEYKGVHRKIGEKAWEASWLGHAIPFKQDRGSWTVAPFEDRPDVSLCELVLHMELRLPMSDDALIAFQRESAESMIKQVRTHLGV